MTITHVMDGLSYGDLSACAAYAAQSALVHACKEPCHRAGAGYATRSLEKTHPHYLSLERGRHLYLNMIDPPQSSGSVTPLRSAHSYPALCPEQSCVQG